LVVGGVQSGDFDEHSRHQLNSFDEFSVDVHVIRKHSSSFFLFVVSVLGDTLTEQFLELAGVDDVVKSIHAFLDQTKAESAQTELNEGSVVDNLSTGIEIGAEFSKMGHQEIFLGNMISTVDTRDQGK